MLIVDSQIHIWENAKMSGHHRQIPTYSKDDALKEMADAGVDAALIHPPSSLPQTVPTAIEAARLHPDKFAILGHFPVEKPESRALIATWKQQPGMLGLRFTFNQPQQQSWWTDGTLDWLWPAAERAGIPIGLLAGGHFDVVARVAERHHRPVVMIALPEQEGELASGSGRSIPAFDLLGGLSAAAAHLVRYGGHRAAAGLTIEAQCVEAFREAFVAHAAEALTPADMIVSERVDAITSGEEVGLALAEELARLAPFGAGNPAISLLLPAATFSDPVGFGGERRQDHARFTVNSGTGRARAVRFGSGTKLGVDLGTPVDATFTLVDLAGNSGTSTRNRWHLGQA